MPQQNSETHAGACWRSTGPCQIIAAQPQSCLHVTFDIWLLSSSCRLSPVPPNSLHDHRFFSPPASSTAGALAVESRDGRAGEPLPSYDWQRASMSNRCRYLRLENNSTSVLGGNKCHSSCDSSHRLARHARRGPGTCVYLVSYAGRVRPRDQQTPPRCARNPVAESRSALRGEAQAPASNKSLRLCWYRDRVKLNGMCSSGLVCTFGSALAIVYSSSLLPCTTE
jgi:hypothetical protein